MKYIYILKIGETFTSTKNRFGDFDTWIIDFIGRTNKTVKVITIKNNVKLPSLKSAAGFIITGSHSMVTEKSENILLLEKYVRKIDVKKIPLLGICFGHQLIANALGGNSDYNKKGKEIGKVRIKLRNNVSNDLLLKNFPKQFDSFETHYQSVLKLPRKAIVLASNFKDKHQIVRFSKYIWGVQFHPEFHKNIMKEYILNQEKELKKLGFNSRFILNNISNCTVSNKILNNFLGVLEAKSFVSKKHN